jgi:uncharacterized protein YegP (UPF0339 family)
MAAKFEVYVEADGRHNYRLHAANGDVLAEGRGYEGPKAVLEAMGALKTAASEAVIPTDGQVSQRG